jgi:hypothetical protein
LRVNGVIHKKVGHFHYNEDGEMRGSGDRAIESYMKRLIIKTAWGREQSSRLKGVSMQGFSTKRF